jgi:hypothetical protein
MTYFSHHSPLFSFFPCSTLPQYTRSISEYKLNEENTPPPPQYSVHLACLHYSCSAYTPLPSTHKNVIGQIFCLLPVHCSYAHGPHEINKLTVFPQNNYNKNVSLYTTKVYHMQTPSGKIFLSLLESEFIQTFCFYKLTTKDFHLSMWYLWCLPS